MSQLRDQPSITYELDDATRLTAVGGDWDRFARENGAPELIAPLPLGRPLRSFIADVTTAHLCDQVLERARATGRPLSFPIRCDSPDMRRELRLHVAFAGGTFAVRSDVISLTPRDPMPVPPAGIAGEGALLRACSWCKRVDAHGRWVEIEEAVSTLSLFRRNPPPEITHGMCGRCYDSMEGLLAAS